MRKALFCLLSLVVTVSSALAADFPKGYLVYSSYAGGKMDVTPFESIDINNQYNGTIKTAANRSTTFSNKLVGAVIVLDADLNKAMPEKLKGENATFLSGKVVFVDLTSGKSDLDDLRAQKKLLEKTITVLKLGSPITKVAEELDAVLARTHEAAVNAPPAEVDPKDAVFSFVTVNGEQHLKVRVTGVSESGVNLAMDNGISRVTLDQVPEGAKMFPEPWRLEIAKVKEGIAKRAADAKRKAEEEAALKAAEEAAAKKVAEEAEAAKKEGTAPAPAAGNTTAAPEKPTTAPGEVVDVKATGTPAAAPKK